MRSGDESVVEVADEVEGRCPSPMEGKFVNLEGAELGGVRISIALGPPADG